MTTIFQRLIVILSMLSPVVSFGHLPVTQSGNVTVPSLSPMLSKVTPSVVNIVVVDKPEKSNDPFHDTNNRSHDQDVMSGIGSGIIFNAKKGYIITNAHVIEDAKIMLVTLKDGRRFPAKLIAKDDGFDIAIIQIPAIDLKALLFADSNNLKVGDFVAAIGSPYGLTQTVTSGVVSALDRAEPKIEGYQSFIQTDAPINPGNSGGALVNLNGQLVGINTAIFTPNYGSIGIGFAIPSNMIKSVVDQLLKYGKVRSGVLGVIAQNITPELADALALKDDDGVVVTQVIAHSSAAKAGILQRDVIRKINNEFISTSTQLRNTLGLMRPNTKITITVLRNHKDVTLNATVGDPNAQVPSDVIPFLSGMSLENFDYLESDGSIVKGVRIGQISDTSPGALAGLMRGDVITNAENTRITDLSSLIHVAQHAGKNELLLTVSRDGQNLFAVVQE